MIKYLALFPQQNEISSVSDLPSGITDSEAYQKFRSVDPSTGDKEFFPRCWIHTHACYQAYMSHVDIFQMFYCIEVQGMSFCMVISPRIQGLKVLGVRLTENGTNEIRGYMEQCMQNMSELRTLEAVAAIVQEKIDASPTKFFYQVPFHVAADPCIVADFRNKRESVDYLFNSAVEKKAEMSWLETHKKV